MPGKPNNLPLPCPICDKPNGTIQLLFTGKDDVIIRIGHYDSDGYKEAKKEHEKLLKTSKENIKLQEESGLLEKSKGINRTKQRRWCSFRSNNLFFKGLSDDLVDDMVAGKRDFVSHREPPQTLSLTEHGRLNLKQHIQRFGWLPLQN